MNLLLTLAQILVACAATTRPQSPSEKQRETDRTYRRHRFLRTDPNQDNELLRKLIANELEQMEQEYDRMSRIYASRHVRYLG